MANPDLKQLITDYLAEVFLMQLATSVGDKPWACTVHFVADDRRSLYFLSRPDRRHSKEIAINPNVAGAIVTPHKIDERPRGLQFEGTAAVAEGDDLARGAKVHQVRFGFSELREHSMYVVKPSSIVLYDMVNFPDEPRQELRLG